MLRRLSGRFGVDNGILTSPPTSSSTSSGGAGSSLSPTFALSRARAASKAGSDATKASSASKTSGETPFVVQHEGWVLKRGAGYTEGDGNNNGNNDSEEEDSVKPTLPPLPPPPTAAGRATVAKKPNALASLLMGKDEKRRYMMLLTRAADKRVNSPNQSSASSIKEGPRAELRYFVKGRPESLYAVKPKGQIFITADMKAELDSETCTIKLHGSSRTFFIRPDDPSSGTARTSVSQWLSAIKFAIAGLRSWELAGAEGHHPLQDRRSMRASLKIENPPQQVVEGLAVRAHRARSVAGKAPSSDAKLGPFADLWATHGIDAYETILSHFGPVQMDLKRLKDHYTHRVAQTKSELQVLEQETTRSRDVLLKEQSSTHGSMNALRQHSQIRTKALKTYLKTITESCIPKLEEIHHNVGVRLEAIVAEHKAAVSYVDAAKKAVQTIEKKIALLQEALTNSLTNKLPPINASRRPSKEPMGNMDVARLSNELAEAREAMRDAHLQLVTTEAMNAQSISKAVNYFEDIEKSRLTVLLSTLKIAAKAEADLVDALQVDIPQLEDRFENVEASLDVKNTFVKLKIAAEKTRAASMMTNR